MRENQSLKQSKSLGYEIELDTLFEGVEYQSALKELEELSKQPLEPLECEYQDIDMLFDSKEYQEALQKIKECKIGI